MSVLPDFEIHSWAEVAVTPFDPKMVNPASLDLKLSPDIKVLSSNTIVNGYADHLELLLPDVQTFKLFEGQKFVLQPGMFILASSIEYVKMPFDAAGQVMLKSSTARSGIGHVYSGWIDPGFEGNITFEMFSHIPVLLEPGKPICQLVLYEMKDVPSKLYGETGRYQGQTGPTEVRSGRID